MIGNVWNFLVELGIDVWAVIIAAIALVFTFWQNRMNRKHNKLSVRPALMFYHNYSSDVDETGVFVVNNGLGPAILKSFKVHAGKNTFIGNNNDGAIGLAIRALGITYPYVRYLNTYDGEIIPAGGKLRCFWISDENYLDSNVTLALKNVLFEIKYESLYKNKHTATWRSS